jgi:C2H2-type zinc finger
MLHNCNTVLGPDGKVLKLFNSMDENGASSAASSEALNDSSHKCQVCDLQFETEKTLKLHLELKHIPSTVMYQCPSCTQKFSTSAAVLKHLSDEHK